MKTNFAAPVLASLVLVLAGCGRAPVDNAGGGGDAIHRDPDAARAQVAAKSKQPAPAVAKPSPAAVAAPGAVIPHEDASDSEHCDCKQGSCEMDATEDDGVVDVHLANAPIRGAAKAPVTIVVFDDFQCPFCAKAEDTLRDIATKYGDKVKIAFKNNPLPFHDNARPAARASMAASEQGKFWEYHDALFSHRRGLGRDALVATAEDLGLDLIKFEAALDAPRTEAAVAADVAEATRLEIKGTPAFFINGKRLVGAQPKERFEAMIDAALAARH